MDELQKLVIKAILKKLDWQTNPNLLNQIPKNLVKEYFEYIPWYKVQAFQNLTLSDVYNYKHLFNWSGATYILKFLEIFYNETKFSYNYQIQDEDSLNKDEFLCECFILTFQSVLDWDIITQFLALSDRILFEFKEFLNWTYISTHYILSENTIRQYQDYINWSRISSSQELSENFICEFQHKICWQNLSIATKYRIYSSTFEFEFRNLLDPYYRRPYSDT